MVILFQYFVANNFFLLIYALFLIASFKEKVKDKHRLPELSSFF